MSHESSYESGQRFSKFKMVDVIKLGVSTETVNSVVRYATIFVSRIYFNRRTSSEVEIIQRMLVTAEDLGTLLLKWVGKDGHFA